MVRWPSVLVVEDDAELRAVVLEVLRSEGYDVTGAEEGTEAVRAIRARQFDVILMDKNLPGPSGLALLPELLKMCPGTRVIMMTAFGDVPSYVEAVEKGAADYLFKPFLMEELKSAIRKVLALDAAWRV